MRKIFLKRLLLIALMPVAVGAISDNSSANECGFVMVDGEQQYIPCENAVSPSGGGGSSASMPTVGDIEMGDEMMPSLFSDPLSRMEQENTLAESALADCMEASKSAVKTCGILTSPAITMGMAMFQGIGGAVSGGGGSMKERCESAAMFSQLGTALNSTFAAGCLSVAGICDSTCNTKAASAKGQSEGEIEMAKQEDAKYRTCYVDAVKRNIPKGNTDKEVEKAAGRQANIVCKRHYMAAKQALSNSRVYKKVATKAAALEGACESMYIQTLPAVMQAAASAVTWAAANNCANQSSGFNIAEFCAKSENKSNPSCGGAIDCKTASGSMSRDCICADPAKAKSNPLCKDYRAPGPGGTPNIASRMGNGDAGKDALAGLGDGGEFGGVTGGNGDNLSKSGEVAQGGGGGPGGGGAGGGINPDDKGGEAKDYKTEVNEGFIKGGKGGDVGMYGSFGGSGGGGGGRGESDLPKFDLSKYLPGQKKEQMRMMATQGLKAEGVTAASGPSIWEKVSNRMKALRGNLK